MMNEDHVKSGIDFIVRGLIKYDTEKYSDMNMTLAVERVLSSELYRYVSDARTLLFMAPLGCVVKAYDIEIQLGADFMLNYIADLYLKFKR